jgi:hypothetical protein
LAVLQKTDRRGRRHITLEKYSARPSRSRRCRHRQKP